MKNVKHQRSSACVIARRVSVVILAALTGDIAAPQASALAVGAAQTRTISQPTAHPTQITFEALQGEAERARAGGDLQRAIGLYRQAVELKPSWVEGHWYLGTLSYETEQYAECRESFGQVVRLQSDNGAAWAFKGLCEFQIKAYPQALADLSRGRTLGLGDNPELVGVARFHEAILRTRAGEYEGAIQALTSLANEATANDDLVVALGLALLRMPLVPEEVRPEQRDRVMLAGRAVLFSAARSTQRAKANLEELVRRYPDTPNVHYANGLFLGQENPDKALEEFRAELRISPDHAMARVQIAEELLKRGEIDAAMPIAVDAARLAPGNFVARRVLGRLKLEAGDVPGAIAELEAAAQLEPTSPSVRFSLARAYQRAGRPADAERERGEFTRLERLLRIQRGGANAVGDPEAADGSNARPQPER